MKNKRKCGPNKPGCEHHWHGDGQSDVCCHCGKREWKWDLSRPTYIPSPFVVPDPRPWWVDPVWTRITWNTTTDNNLPAVNTNTPDWRVT